ECSKQIPLARGAPEHDDSCLGVIPENGRDRGDAPTGQLRVDQAEVRSLACRRLDRFRPLGRLGADSAAGVLECAAHAGASARRAVCDEYPHGPTEGNRRAGPAEPVLSAGFGNGSAWTHESESGAAKRTSLSAQKTTS